MERVLRFTRQELRVAAMLLFLLLTGLGVKMWRQLPTPIAPGPDAAPSEHAVR